jgi:hypothetical protein
MSDHFDMKTLDRISEPLGYGYGDGEFEGEQIPLIRPRDPAVDPDEFDTTVCAAGLPRFLRPRLPGDLPPDDPPESAMTHILVSELLPGVQTRVPVEFHRFADFN